MNIPLPEQLRPKSLDEFVGQEHLVGEKRPIRRMIEIGKIPSMIFWGPPGTGKTTLARIIGESINANFIKFSAIDGSVKDVRRIVQDAQGLLSYSKPTVLFVDEIHRFNKAQQDAFLPHVENGTIILIGATTENPGFEVNAPLISRSQVFIFHELQEENLVELVKRAIKLFPEKNWDEKAIEHIAKSAGGDARAAINAVEMSADLAKKKISLKMAEEAVQKKALYYDKKGDSHYDTISAFIKSMRGGDADATLYYLAKMLKAGEDPVFIARRMVIFASEDITNARPNALVLAVNCMQAVHMVGMPEAQLILAQTATYLASAPKSTASMDGLFAAYRDINEFPGASIPMHLRNAPNKVMKAAGYGKGHIRYPYKEEKRIGKKVNQKYLPKELEDREYYKPDWE